MSADALPVPPDLKPLLDKHAGVDWGSIAWDAVRVRAAQLEAAEVIAARSRLTAERARALARNLREGP